MEIKPLNNFIQVRPDEINNTYQMQNGHVLIFDHLFNRAEHDVISGVVVSAPEEYRLHKYDHSDLVDLPLESKLHRSGMPKLKPVKDVANIQVGDRIFFHHNAFSSAIDAGHVIHADPTENSTWSGHRVEYILIDPDMPGYQSAVYFAIRDGEIIPLFDSIICERILDKPAVTASGIILDPFGKNKYLDKQLKVVSRSDWGNDWYGSDSLKSGSTVFHEKDADVEITIDAGKPTEKTVIVLSKDYVLAVVD